MEEKAPGTSVRGVLYVVAQLTLLALVVAGPESTGGGAPWPAPWGMIARVAGVALGIVGGLFTAAGALHLGSNLSPLPRPRADAQLVRSGAYRFARHPIYSGIIFGSFGWALFVNGSLTVVYALLLAMVLDVKARYEESLLRIRFEEYAAYQREVARFIPFLY